MKCFYIVIHDFHFENHNMLNLQRKMDECVGYLTFNGVTPICPAAVFLLSEGENLLLGSAYTHALLASVCAEPTVSFYLTDAGQLSEEFQRHSLSKMINSRNTY